MRLACLAATTLFPAAALAEPLAEAAPTALPRSVELASRAGSAEPAAAAALGVMVFASDPAAIASLLATRGYETRLGTDSYGDPMIETASQGVAWDMIFFDCDGGAACRSVQFVTGFDLEDGLAVGRVNHWNRENRYAKVYLDREGDPFIEFDVNLEGGATEANFLSDLAIWNELLAAFVAHISE